MSTFKDLPNLDVELSTVRNYIADEPVRPSFDRTDSPTIFDFCIDNSTLERFAACPKSAELYVVHRREGRSTAALAFGSAIHEALEIFYTRGFVPSTLALARQAFMDSTTHRPLDESNWRTADHGLKIVEKYYNEFRGKENLTVHRVANIPFVEQGFKLLLGTIDLGGLTPLGGTANQLTGTGGDIPLLATAINVYWTGKIDVAGHVGSHLWIMDHKTTSMLGQAFWDQFELSSQTIGYTWAFRELTGLRPMGAIINCLALREPTPSGRPIRFERHSFVYSEEQLDEWKSDTLTLVADFISHLTRGYFPRARLWCIGKYGKCQYHEVCASPSTSRPSVLATNRFKNVSWNPLAH